MSGPAWFHGDSLTDNQRIILDLWDEGCGSQEIMRRTRRPRADVMDVLTRYAVTTDQRRTRAAAASGSASLLAAMQRHFEHRRTA